MSVLLYLNGSWKVTLIEQHYNNSIAHDIITLLTNAQHYRPGHSTSTALIHLTDEWLACIKDKKLVGALLLDYPAAFDNAIIIAKLKY